MAQPGKDLGVDSPKGWPEWDDVGLETVSEFFYLLLAEIRIGKVWPPGGGTYPSQPTDQTQI